MGFELNSRELLFPVPLFAFDLAGSAKLNAALQPEIAARRAREAGASRSNRGGWHSAPDWFDRTEPAHCELADHIRTALREATANVVSASAAVDLHFDLVGWANVATRGDHHSPHDHPGAFWSGVYYVACEPDSGDIEFLSGRGCDPNGPLLSVPMTWDFFRVKPKAGLLLLFPGHLKHWVAPNGSETPRMSMAFNARLTEER